MILTHISEEPVTEVKVRLQGQRNVWKPEGFWFSVDDGWEKWCEAEQPDWIEDRIRYRVHLGDENLLHLSTIEETREFHKRWVSSGFVSNLITTPNWAEVAEIYDGIIIAPYYRRIAFDMDMIWYSSWDCASGCIWNPRGVRVEVDE